MARGGPPSDSEATTESTNRKGADDHTTVSASAAHDLDPDLKDRAMDEAPVGITIADARRPDMPLVYVNAAFEHITGYSPSYAVGRNCRFLQGEATRGEPVARLRSAIERDEAATVELRNYTRGGDLFWNEVTIAPLSDPDGTVTHYVGFQMDVTERKRAERAAADRLTRIEYERDAREHLLERLDGVVADVTEAVMGADTRPMLEQAVANSLSDTYAGAWVGIHDPVEDAVVPRASAGAVPPDAADGPISLAAPNSSVERAVASALDERTIRVESATGADPVVAAVVSLHYGEASYGAICVFARNQTAFESHERAVLTALGRTVATGVNAVESQLTLRSEDGVKLCFSLAAEDHPLVAVASALDCRLTYLESVADRDPPGVLFELAGTDADDVAAAVAETPIRHHATLFDGDGRCVVEWSLADAFRAALADYGAELRGVEAEGDRGVFTVETTRESLARSLADALTDRYQSADVVGFQRSERRPETRHDFRADVEAALTDRQRAALVRAHSSGFFEWPHETTGDELAAAMDVTRSTFHQHLRAAERKLVAALFGDRPEPN